jgi:hypothetical protein
MCSTRCNFPDSCFIIFQVVFILLSDFYKSTVMLPFSLFYNSTLDFAILTVICSHVWIITASAIYIYIDSFYACKIF